MACNHMADTGFGRRVLQARHSLAARRGKTLTQVEVGKAMGVSGVAVGSWESGEKEPGSLELVRRLADYLEVSPGWLAFGEEPHVSIRGTLPLPGEDAENVTARPKPKRTEARRRKRA